MRSLRHYLACLIQRSGRGVGLALVLMFLVTATEGVGLVLLVPLLALVGIEAQEGPLGRIAAGVGSLLRAMDLQPALGVMLALFLAAVSLRALLSRWETRVSLTLEHEFAARLRERLYSAIAGARWSFLSRRRSSDLVHVLTAEVDRAGAAAQSLLYLANLGLLTCLYAAAALRLSWQATGLALACGLGLLVLLRGRVRMARVAGEQLTEVTRSVYAAAVEHLAAIKTVKVYSAEGRTVTAFSAGSVGVLNVNRTAVANQADVKFWVDVGSAAVLSVMVFAARETLRLSAAELLMLIFLFARMVPRLGVMQQVYQAFVGLLPGFESVARLQRECEEAAERLPVGGARVPLLREIRFEDVSFRYGAGDPDAIRGLNLVIPAGQITAIVGPSGAGKSTVADLVLGLIEPTRGRIRVDGRVLDPDLRHGWRASVGYVAQDGLLFHDTIRANLLWARPDVTETEMVEALHMASADEFVSRLPRGLDTVVGDRGVLLSAGERQRLMLARALLRRPALLVLDEATNAVDAENEQRIRRAIDALKDRLTILLITHRLSVVQGAGVIYVIDRGELVESGPWTDLLVRPDGRLRALLDAGGADRNLPVGAVSGESVPLTRS